MIPRPAPAVHQIRFCTTADRVKIAYATAGSGIPLVKTPNWLNHLELDVESVVWRGWMARMAERFRLVRYDARGCGLSDRDVPTGDFETNLIDLDAVVDAAGLTRFVLFGASQGSSIAVKYAAQHPDRVSHLILCGAYLRGILKRDPSPVEVEEAQTLLKMVELGWGRENSAFRQVFAAQFIPDSSLEHLRAFDDIQRRTATPEVAARLLAGFYQIDVSGCAASVSCPTLVMHSRGDARIPFEEGRRVAGAIPGAEFVPLDSRNHILLEHQSAWRKCFEEIDRFLQQHADATAHEAGETAGLTASERRVLELLASAMTNTQIASALSISPKTVRNHINHIFSKLDVHDRAHAIVLARDAGFGRGNRSDR